MLLTSSGSWFHNDGAAIAKALAPYVAALGALGTVSNVRAEERRALWADSEK